MYCKAKKAVCNESENWLVGVESPRGGMVGNLQGEQICKMTSVASYVI